MPEGKWNAFENDLRAFFHPGPWYLRRHVCTASLHVDRCPHCWDLLALNEPWVWTGGQRRTFWPPGSTTVTVVSMTMVQVLLTRPPHQKEWRTEQLIEYIGGNVERYAALEDSHFSVAAVVDPDARKGNGT